MTSQKKLRCRTGAGLLIVRLTDEKILLVKRSLEVSMPGYWAAPGGCVEPGESEYEAALREGYEELGSLPEDLAMYDDMSTWENESFRFLTFLGTTSDHGWEPSINWENDDCRWFDPRRLPSPIMPGTIKAIERFLV